MLRDCNCLDKEDKEIILENLKNEYQRLEKKYKRTLPQSPIRLVLDRYKKLIEEIDSTPNC